MTAVYTRQKEICKYLILTTNIKIKQNNKKLNKQDTCINNGRHAAIVDGLWAVWPHIWTFSEINVAGMQSDSWMVWPQCLECTDQVQLPLTLLKHIDVGQSASWHQQSLLHCSWVDTAGTSWNSAVTFRHRMQITTNFGLGRNSKLVWQQTLLTGKQWVMLQFTKYKYINYAQVLQVI